jgi:hypothetical protein
MEALKHGPAAVERSEDAGGSLSPLERLLVAALVQAIVHDLRDVHAVGPQRPAA